MVPATVERRIEGELVSVQLWVEGCTPVEGAQAPERAGPDAGTARSSASALFDNLIANIDRNAGNLLIDDQWNLVLIDHSRAFTGGTMPFEKQMTRIDRAVLRAA